jgi:hypothetical protein
MFREVVHNSILPTLELDVSGNNIGNAVTKIADWMEQTGGLWAK